MTTGQAPAPSALPDTPAGLGVELNGINVIAESERHGRSRDLFWPWCAANISVLGIGYGAYVLGFAVSFWQAVLGGIVGIVASFLLVGLVAISGRRGSAPTMVTSRAAFGVHGNALPAAVSYVLLVGWEVILVSLATLATATVFQRLGWASGNATKVLAFLVVAAVIVLSGVFGFDVIMRLQTWLTIGLAVLTVGYVALTLDHVHWSAVSALPSGSAQAVIGSTVFVFSGFGLGWVNSGGDYSRYLPRSSSSSGVAGWTTFGASVAPVLLLVYGLLLAGSDQNLNKAIGADPIGALTTLLPTWYLVPFVVVALGGLIGGAVLDIYSSGLALLTLGLRVPRWAAAGLDGVLMILGTIYVVWVASDFFVPFQNFLITMGVPIAAWCGVFLADLLLRRRPYAEADLYVASGRYGSVRWAAVAAMLLGTVAGWGLVTSGSSYLSWEGFLLGPLGLGGRSGDWAFANLGVLVALALGFAVYALAGRPAVAQQESVPV